MLAKMRPDNKLHKDNEKALLKKEASVEKVKP